jgi:hypothetical protein
MQVGWADISLASAPFSSIAHEKYWEFFLPPVTKRKIIVAFAPLLSLYAKLSQGWPLSLARKDGVMGAMTRPGGSMSKFILWLDAPQ